LSYRIEFKTSAAKSLKKIPKADRIRIVEKIDRFTENLPNPDTIKMKGNNLFHKVRVEDYRIIYEIQNETLVNLVVKIGHRNDIHRNLP
jgi:mRNA interferase RelE/StbE